MGSIERQKERGPLQLAFIRQRAEEWRKKNAPIPKFPPLLALLEAAEDRRRAASRRP